MITIENSRSGHPVLKKDGRLLGSSFDPIKEANAWAERAVQEAGDAEAVVVLGLGSGYHVEALKVRLQGRLVIVVECDEAVAKAALRIAPAVNASNVVVEREWHKLIEHTAFCDAVTSRFAIVKHGPSCQINSEYFAQVERLLIGREKIAFLLQLKTRPDLYALFDPKAIETMGDELVSVKTLQRLFSESGALSRERRLWKILEELVV